MSEKYELAIRGLDVKVMPRRVFGPWHSVMYGVYTLDGVLLDLFMSYSDVLDCALREGHRVRNMMSVLLAAADECRIMRQVDRMFLEMAFPNVKRQLERKTQEREHA